MGSSQREELCQLIDAVIEGRASGPEMLRLQELASSEEGQKVYLDYLLLLGELHWAAAGIFDASEAGVEAAARLSGPTAAKPGTVPQLSHIFRSTRMVVVTAVVTSLCLLVATGWWLWRPFDRSHTAAQEPIATCVGLFEGEFETPPPRVGGVLYRDEKVHLRKGLAAWRDQYGTTWTAEGPFSFRASQPGCLEIATGKAVVRLGSNRRGFVVKTPHGEIADRGTSFAVDVTDRTTGVHVLSGSVLLQSCREVSRSATKELHEGEAARLDAHGEVAIIPWEGDRFWAEIPAKGSVAAWRFAAVHHPRAWLWGGFEREPPALRWFHENTSVPVLPVRMRGTFSPISPEVAGGYDARSRALLSVRGSGDGNAQGLGWQTETPILLPSRFTVEIIFRFDGWPEATPGAIGSLLAVREPGQRCGFLVAAVSSPTGRLSEAKLTHLFSSDDEWADTNGVLTAGRWYYVASTFHVDKNANSTEVKTYLQDLSERDPLEKVFEGRLRGTIPTCPLGIGKGFDERLAHAYPFPGAIDEVCLYNDIVGEEVLAQHADLLVPTKRASQVVMPLPQGTPGD